MVADGEITKYVLDNPNNGGSQGKPPYWLLVGLFFTAVAIIVGSIKFIIVSFLIGCIIGVLFSREKSIMLWRRCPYWLRGGMVGGGIAFIYAVLLYSCAYTVSDYGIFGCMGLFELWGPAYVTDLFINFLAPVFQYDWIFAETHALILSIPLFFIAGLVVGSLVGFIKSRNKFAIYALLTLLFIISLALRTLVTKSSTSIVSVFPTSARVGDTINIKVSNFGHEGYSRVHLIKYGNLGEGYRTEGQLWVGKISDSDTISFSLKEKNCFDSSCDLLSDAVPGKYKLRVTGPGRGETALEESDFEIVP